MSRHLWHLANEVETHLANDSSAEPEKTGVKPSSLVPSAKLLDLVEATYRARRRREKLLGVDIFGEPAWDILLDMYANVLKGKRASTSSLCLASMVPNTTALRYLDRLEEAGFIERKPSRRDARVRYPSLTSKGFEAMSLYFSDQALVAAKDETAQSLFFRHNA
ncbi:MarR family transcriptional regulator [Sphingobium yanoikuyae]|nr:MarR family transcriptional regulator [Sphingobium yanoikuyae]